MPWESKKIEGKRERVNKRRARSDDDTRTRTEALQRSFVPLLLSDIIYKVVGKAVLLIGLVVFAADFFPFVDIERREVSISFVCYRRNMGEAKAVCQRKGGGIDAFAPYAINLFVGSASLQSFFDRVENLDAWRCIVRLTADDKVSPVWQGTLGKGLEGLTPHEDGVSRRELLEVTKVGWQIIE